MRTWRWVVGALLVVGCSTNNEGCEISGPGGGPNPGSGVGSGTPRPPRPPPTDAYAITVVVRPNLSSSPHTPFGTIREEDYVASLRVQGWARDAAGVIVGTILKAGWERPGTYTVTVEAPGYHTWVRRGVVVVRDSDGELQTVHLSAHLVEVP